MAVAICAAVTLIYGYTGSCIFLLITTKYTRCKMRLFILRHPVKLIGENMINLRYGFGLAVVLILTACATPAPIASQEELSKAEREGQLLPIYNKLEGEKIKLEAGSEQVKQVQAQMEQIGKKMAVNKQQQIAATLVAAKDANGMLTYSDFEQAIGELAEVKNWDAPFHARWQLTYAQQLQDMKGEIDQRVTQIQKLGQEQISKKLSMMQEVANLYGGEKGAQYEQLRNDAIVDLYNRAVIAVDGKSYEEAKSMLESVAVGDPEFIGLEEQKLRIETGTFEQRFWDALGAGHPDEAYQLFYQLSLSPGFPMVKDQISQTAGDISNYFIALGKKEMEKGRLSEAYLAYKRANYIRRKINPKAPMSKDEKKFIKVVERRFERAQKKNISEYALAYLFVLKELSPKHALVKRNIRTLKGLVLEEAAVKLSPSPFSNSSEERSFGRGLSSKVSQFLLQKIPDDIRILEREQFDRLQRKMKEPGPSSYLSHYYLQGEILDAEVDTSEKASNRTRRVITGYDTQSNPKYQEWLALSKREKRDVTKPSELKRVVRREDVNIKATITKKVGVFSAIFRLVDPFTAKVIFVDSVTQKQSYEDESIEGMELGKFKQEAKVADLPSESEILESLADLVSEKIGERLIEELDKPEQKYAQYAQIAIDEDNLEAAASNYAYATTLALQKDVDAQVYMESLRIYVFKADK